MPSSLAMPGEAVGRPQMGVMLLLSLAVLKTLATGLDDQLAVAAACSGRRCSSAGCSAAYGQFVSWWLPGTPIDPAAFVLVGMGGFFAGVFKTPPCRPRS
ncbi:MAG: hypothetical protein U0800_05930 [Isosphaeraceae bacterium]